jgi:hypothetical protein
MASRDTGFTLLCWQESMNDLVIMHKCLSLSNSVSGNESQPQIKVDVINLKSNSSFLS